MRAMADDKRAQSAQEEIEEDENSIGEDAEKNLFEDVNENVMGTWKAETEESDDSDSRL